MALSMPAVYQGIQVSFWDRQCLELVELPSLTDRRNSKKETQEWRTVYGIEAKLCETSNWRGGSSLPSQGGVPSFKDCLLPGIAGRLSSKDLGSAPSFFLFASKCSYRHGVNPQAAIFGSHR